MTVSGTVLHHLELQVLAFTKADLERLSTEERTALLLFGHIANELAVLNKLHLWTSYSVQRDGVLGQAGIMQASVITRLLAGKLREAWHSVEQAYFKSSLSRQYGSGISPAGQTALEACKKYFSQKNRLHDVRNSFAFHYSIDETRRGFDRIDPAEPLQFILAEGRGNNLYYASEVVIGTAQNTTLGAADVREGLGEFLGEVTGVGDALLTFLDQLIAIMLREHFGDPDEVLRLVTISDVPSVESVHIPYFVAAGTTVDDT